MSERMEKIRKKGFDMSDTRRIQDDDFLNSLEPIVPNQFKQQKIKVGMKTLEDAVVTFSDLKDSNSRFTDKKAIYSAIENSDYEEMRAISNYYYKVSGIYNRLCRYMAYMYRYDWMVTPFVKADNIKVEKELQGFYKCLDYLDNFGVKRFFGEIALKVIRNGSFYGYVVEQNGKGTVQELPAKYCRSRFKTLDSKPAVEFNMRFFDEEFRDINQKMKILNMFPKEFKKGYILYKQGKLPGDFMGDRAGWYLLDTKYAIRFDISGDEFPMLISIIPAIIDLEEAKGLELKKMQQQLLKVIIQKLPIDKNGDLIFDIDEARELHNNIVQMIGKAIGVDVVTTFGDVSIADVAEKNTSVTADELEKMERSVYNEGGTSQMLFNADGAIQLEKSIQNDEASLYNLIQQFEDFLNYLIEQFNTNPKKIEYKVQILPTTIYNYQALAKLYKEQTQIGYSKMLPQIALGQSQSNILASAYFENDVLELFDVFIPPLTSNTMSSEMLQQKAANSKENRNAKQLGDQGEAGRPTKESQGEVVTEKTIKNKESMS